MSPNYPLPCALEQEAGKTVKGRVGSGDPMDVVGRKMRRWTVEGPYLHCLPLLVSGSLFNLFQVFLQLIFRQVLPVGLPLANTQLRKGWRVCVCVLVGPW